jgi:hypothetical protein
MTEPLEVDHCQLIRETSDLWLLSRLAQSPRDVQVTILATLAVIKQSRELLKKINGSAIAD